MDIAKLKLNKFKNIQIHNFPKGVDLGIESTDKNVEVIIYYIQTIKDVMKFVKLVNSTTLPKENRTILVYEKGRKDGVNRDSIIMPFKSREIEGFQLKAPMLCSLSETLSAFVSVKVHSKLF